MLFQVHFSSIFGKVVSRLGIQPNPQKLKVFTGMPPPKMKKELQAVLNIIKYVGKFSPRTVEVCESLGKLTSAKVAWTWNATYRKMFEEAKAIIKEDACMKFYDETKPLYIEINASGADFGSSPTTNQRQHDLSQRWSARQQLPWAHCICQQEPHWSREEVQQHWERNTRYTIWSWKVSSL